MTYRVQLQTLAIEDLRSAYLVAAGRAPTAAANWLGRFHVALQTLNQRPERCPLAPESRRCGVELREFLFGKQPNAFRVVFIVDGEFVRILRFRRAQRRWLSRPEINEALGGISGEPES
jgi:hypothetical protein